MSAVPRNRAWFWAEWASQVPCEPCFSRSPPSVSSQNDGLCGCQGQPQEVPDTEGSRPWNLYDCIQEPLGTGKILHNKNTVLPSCFLGLGQTDQTRMLVGFLFTAIFSTLLMLYYFCSVQVVKILEKHEQQSRSSTGALSFLSAHVTNSGSSTRLGAIPADEASAVQNYVEHMLFLLMEEEAGQGEGKLKFPFTKARRCPMRSLLNRFLWQLCALLLVLPRFQVELWVPSWSSWCWRGWWSGCSCGAWEDSSLKTWSWNSWGCTRCCCLRLDSPYCTTNLFYGRSWCCWPPAPGPEQVSRRGNIITWHKTWHQGFSQPLANWTKCLT